MSRDSIRITENHIYCDDCELDSADVIGYSTGISMKGIVDVLKSKGWKISRNRELCNNCK